MLYHSPNELNINYKQAFKELLERYENIKIGTAETAVELMQSHFYPDGVKYVTVKKF